MTSEYMEIALPQLFDDAHIDSTPLLNASGEVITRVSELNCHNRSNSYQRPRYGIHRFSYNYLKGNRQVDNLTSLRKSIQNHVLYFDSTVFKKQDISLGRFPFKSTFQEVILFLKIQFNIARTKPTNVALYSNERCYLIRSGAGQDPIRKYLNLLS